MMLTTEGAELYSCSYLFIWLKTTFVNYREEADLNNDFYML